MENIIDILLSPFGLIVFLLFVAFYYIFILKPIRYKKSCLKLLNYFDGEFSFPLGDIALNYSGAKFYISRIARGGGGHGTGSYPVLWAEVGNHPKFIIGNAKSKNYTRGGFLILPPHEIVKLGESEILVGSADREFLTKIKNTINNDRFFADRILILFQKDFSHLTVSPEFHIGKNLIHRKYIFRYTCLSEEIYQHPDQLEASLNIIIDLFEKLKLR